jgi:hypothetical protein
MNLNKHTIAFKKGMAIIPDDSQHNPDIVNSVQMELMHVGLCLDEKATEALYKADPVWTTEWASAVITEHNRLIGNPLAKPLHPEFPEGDFTRTYDEEYWNSVRSIWYTGKYVPTTPEVARDYHFEHSKFKMITVGTEDDFKGIFKTLVSINMAISPTDFKIVQWFLQNYDDTAEIMPDKIPFKENLCMIAAEGYDVPVKTPTDVLRIAQYMSTGKSDLLIPAKRVKTNSWSNSWEHNPEYDKAKFKRWTRKERRYLLGLLDKVANISEMAMYQSRWVVLAHGLHAGDYASQFPKAYKAIDAVRNKNLTTWMGQVDRAFNRNFLEGLVKLAERPGFFARQLDWRLRSAPSAVAKKQVLDTFRTIGPKISSKVLWELWTHFEERAEQKSRKVWIKGARKPTPLPTLPAMDQRDIDQIKATIWEIFSDKFSEMDELGDVFIDERLKDLTLPTNMSTITETATPIMRGQKVEFSMDKPWLRLFMHWTAGVDLDLSISLYSNTGGVTHCSFGRTRPHPTVFHSGDVIPNHTGNHAEYIDIKVDETPFRYGLMTVRNFRGGSLNNLGALAGFMLVEQSTRSRVWTPKLVEQSFAPNAACSNAALLLFDFKEKCYYMIDEDMNGIPVERGVGLLDYIKRLAEPPAISVYDLLKLHAEARGRHTIAEEDATTVWKLEDFNTSYEKISEMML